MTRPALLRFFAALLGLLCLAGVWHLAARPWVQPRPPSPVPAVVSHLPLEGITVILDPGHGGEDPGAVCPYATEAAYTYRAALEIGQALTARGATVVYTVRSRALDPAYCARQADLPLPSDAVLVADGQPIRERHSPRQLWLRAAPARRLWAARSGVNPENRCFFLSLHLDDSSDAGVHGSLVCVDRRRATPAFGIALAHALVQDNLARHDVFAGHRGLSARQLGVLNPEYNPIPQSVLLEIATLSHFDDLISVSDPAWRARMGDRIAGAIVSVRGGDKTSPGR